MIKSMIQKFTLENTTQINVLLDRCSNKDVFHTTEYMQIFQDYTGHKAVYFFYVEDNKFTLLPYFEKPAEKEGYIDLVSSWYYGGPIFNINDKDEQKMLYSRFLKEFHNYCVQNKIINEFQRLNPILKNHEVYSDDLCLYFDRNIVYVDLTKDYEKIYCEYEKKARKNINRAVQNELKIVKSESEEDIKNFIRIYQRSMDRKGARDFYYFNNIFFNKLFLKLKGKAVLFSVIYKNKTICSSIELGGNMILHDYLRGSESDNLLLRPNDVLIDEVIKWAKSVGYKYFVMGGGATNSEEDGIFKFKKSFSATTAPYYLYKKAHQ